MFQWKYKLFKSQLSVLFNYLNLESFDVNDNDDIGVRSGVDRSMGSNGDVFDWKGVQEGSAKKRICFCIRVGVDCLCVTAKFSQSN